MQLFIVAQSKVATSLGSSDRTLKINIFHNIILTDKNMMLNKHYQELTVIQNMDTVIFFFFNDWISFESLKGVRVKNLSLPRN